MNGLMFAIIGGLFALYVMGGESPRDFDRVFNIIEGRKEDEND